MTTPKFPTRTAAKDAGYYSRRHRDSGPQRDARELYLNTRGPVSRRATAAACAAERASRSDVEQLQLIAKRPGKSAKETARIMARISAPKKRT